MRKKPLAFFLLLSASACASAHVRVDGYSYTHDPLGLRTNIVRDFGLTTNSVAVGYDNIGQLTSWSAKESNNSLRQNEQLGWGYDAAHNLQSRANGSLLQTFNSDAVNELTNIFRTGTLTLSGATPVPATNISVNGSVAERYGDFTFARTNLSLNNGSNAFTNIARNVYGLSVTNTLTVALPANVNLQYDSNGNLTNDGTRSFVYDAENRLTNVYVVTAWKAEFVYDGWGRRRIARDYTWTGSAWLKTNETRYICDGMLPVQERDSNNVAQVTYTRGLDFSGSIHGGGGIGGLLARTDANGSAYYHADGSGNVTALMGANGDLLARYLYNPFGKTAGQWGPLADLNRYRFSSKEFLPPAGLYHFGFRFLDPGLQRWLNHDPLGEYGGGNLYRFAANNPESDVDPDGDSEHNVVATAMSGPGLTFNSLPNLQSPLAPIDPGIDAHILDPVQPRIPIPELREAGMDPSMYNGLLLGGEHLIGTPTGEAIAGNVSDLYSVPILAGMGGMLRGAKFCLPTRVTAVKNLTEALGDPKLRALVADVLKGTRSLSELTAEQRQIAADFYRAIAQDTKGSLGEAASKFNELRADFLEGKTTEVPGNIRSFIERHGLPNQ